MINQQDAAVKFQRALDILRDPQASFTAEMIYSLTDLSGERLAAFQPVWAAMSVERRRSLIQRLVETVETNFELDFSAITTPALDDPDLEIRIAAIEGVLEDSPRPVIERLMKLAQDDPFSQVRAAAVRALGPFVLMGELGKLPPAFNLRLQDTVLALHKNLNEDLDVRRRALESIGNCGREGVLELIREAYYADDLPMRVSALFAMGRSCDESWAPQIMEELSSEYPEMRYEAARAAGELEMRPALPRLTELAYEDDREIQEIAIWSMGEIGGKVATRVLNELAALADSAGDDLLADAVAEALASASLVDEDVLPLFDFGDMDFDPDDDDAAIIDLYGDDDDDDDDDDEDDDYSNLADAYDFINFDDEY